ncbi:ATP-binding protein [Sphingomonas sp. 2R-10]|uniref:ATP-binding protein n=1 Tax=Sphingomonas sp. 2R-10 TaxID=3045148 RepID=UPI0024BB5551|nr:ATP-binding protein [Sphingomonas sp. 2R-10]MDJ0276291.1 ATP-binding protein [Sphingomonas sp. 2R-10]
MRDDGRGIDDPAALLALGRSGWDAEIARSEDPAGMGVFSLAGRDVEIRSRMRRAPGGWRVVIPADAWESGTLLPLEPVSAPEGTEIRLAITALQAGTVSGEVRAAALHHPLPVFLEGTACVRRDFLHGAAAIEEARGCRIGIYAGDAPEGHRLNFHGLQVECRLPQVREVDTACSWSVRVDILDSPDLKLVLPARKEMVENDALAALRIAAERAIYRAIGEKTAHRLPFAAWTWGREIGVDLPPAKAALAAWVPATADGEGHPSPTMIAGEPMLIVPRLEPELARATASVFRKPAFIAARSVDEQEAFAGYAWYDALPRIDASAILVTVDGVTHRYGDRYDAPADLASGIVDGLQLSFSLRDWIDAPAAEDRRFPVDALVCDSGSYDLDDALVLVRRGADITPDRLAAQIEATLFCADDDPDSDSAETQRDRFRRSARTRAVKLLHGADAAQLDGIRTAFADEVRWLIPRGRAVTIVANDAGLAVEWSDPPAG